MKLGLSNLMYLTMQLGGVWFYHEKRHMLTAEAYALYEMELDKVTIRIELQDGGSISSIPGPPFEGILGSPVKEVLDEENPQ